MIKPEAEQLQHRIVSADANQQTDAIRQMVSLADKSMTHSKTSKYSTIPSMLPTALSDRYLIGQTHSYDQILSEARSQAMLERYADLAAIASVDTRQLKVIRQLESTRVTGTAVEKDQENLPTFVSIDYMKNFIPLGPAEPGMRLLKSVTISTKGGESDTSSETSSKKWKLAVDTPDQDSGETKYGILNMGWTTHVPMATVDAQRRDDQLSHILPPSLVPASGHPDQLEATRRKMTLPELATQKTVDRDRPQQLFEWDDMSLPLLHGCSKDKHMCEYYRLLKKQMHHHVSDKGNLRLPKLHGKDKPPEGKPDWTRQSSFGLQYI
ncbi:hypothetical protein LSAT2_025450 [Lamellibrachia satsuma]|nr:hypothetical protein LSAT2_025450 [Lamellibrachia satsuma]